jgi:hypothetical protein
MHLPQHLADLLQVMFGRNSDSPIPIVAPATPGECFDYAIEATRLALKYMTPVAYAELYTALQAGAVDGQDNPLVSGRSMKFYEVTSQFILTNHVLGYDMLAISKKAWSSLNPAQQAKLRPPELSSVARPCSTSTCRSWRRRNRRSAGASCGRCWPILESCWSKELPPPISQVCLCEIAWMSCGEKWS